jgi:hypothetical protein
MHKKLSKFKMCESRVSRLATETFLQEGNTTIVFLTQCNQLLLHKTLICFVRSASFCAIATRCEHQRSNI